ncbi:neuraminidase-like domain-containing protein [Nocardia aurea]|uniref:Neuraminidase-like domain-containing protein n=1 Tax=Nocardia aurea TaxID=2144174 RepID=A0ABV3G512_9NOCA
MADGTDQVIAYAARGAEVAQLHAKLTVLGYEIPSGELETATYGVGTADAVARLQSDQSEQTESDGVVVDAQLDRRISLAVDRSGSAAVIGSVRDPAGVGLSRLRVRLIRRQLNGERDVLDETTSSRHGGYTIRYRRPDVSEAGGSIELVVQVFGSSELPVEVTVPCPVPTVAVVEVVISADPVRHRTVEFTELRTGLRPVLDGVELSGLDVATIQRISCDIGLEADHLAAAVTAATLPATANERLDLGYALARSGIELDAVGLLRRGRESLLSTVQAAAEHRLIEPSEFGLRVDELIDDLAGVVLAVPEGVRAEIGLGPVLTGSGLSKSQQVDLVIRYYGHDGPPETFWADPLPIEPGVVTEVKQRLQFAALCANHAGVVRALRGRGSLPQLAGLDRPQWAALVKNGAGGQLPPGLPGGGYEQQFDAYVDGMRLAVRSAFPGAAAASDLMKSPRIEVDLVREILGRNPGLDVANIATAPVRLDGLDQDLATATLDAVRAELTAYPDLAWDHTDPATIAANPIRAGVATFLRDNPTFELGRNSITEHLAADPDALSGVSAVLRPLVSDQLLRLERIARFTPNIDSAHALLGGGLHSALQIAQVPREQFVSQFGTAFADPEQALAAHDRARTLTTSTTNLFTALHQTMVGLTPAAIDHDRDKLAKYLRRVPNWESLFNETSFCECSDCRSVLGPAAYLVDMLHFLSPLVAPTIGVKPITELLRRRPDLQFIKLSCENTNTELPYVDLVNEILETFIALGGSTAATEVLGQATAKNTPPGVNATDLATTPAYLNESAYDTLRSAYYPFTLPYNRSDDTVRAMLALLGTSRLELMRVFRTGTAPTSAAMTAESLGVAPEMAAVIAGKSTATVAQCYGLPDGTLPGALSTVLSLLEATGLTYPELIELAQTRYINPSRTITLDVATGKDPCDLANVRLRNLDTPALGRLHTFVKLATARAVTFSMLDAELAALGTAAIDMATLAQLVQIDQLRAELGLDAEMILTLIGPIPTMGTVPDGRSVYAERFLSPSLTNPPDPAFVLNAAGTELSGAGEPIADHLAPVLAGLQIGSEDFALLTKTLRADGTLPDSLLSLSTLSILLRHRILARALGLSITDLLNLRALTGLKPSTTVSSTVDFVHAAQAVTESGFSTGVLNTVMRAIEPVDTPVTEPPSATFRRLRDGLQPIIEQTNVTLPATPDNVQRALGLLLGAEISTTVVGTLDGTIEYTAAVAGTAAFTMTVPPALTGSVRFDLTERTLRVTGALTPAARSALDALSTDPDYRAAVDHVYNQPRDLFSAHLGGALTTTDISTLLDGAAIPPGTASPSAPEVFAYLLAKVLPNARLASSRALATQVAAEVCGLAADVTASLLDSVLRSPHDSTAPIIDDLVAVGGTGLSADYFPNTTLTGPALSRTDTVVNFDWGTLSPDPGIPAGPFSVRWTGVILGRTPDPTTFAVTCPGGVRLMIDGIAVIDDWQDQPLHERTGTVTLQPDHAHQLVLEHYHQDGSATIRLAWATSTTPKDVVPAANLFRTDPLAILRAALTRLRNAATVVRGFGLTTAEIVHFAAHSANFSGFDLGAYPLDRATPAAVDAASPKLFSGWRRIANYIALRNSLGGDGATLIAVFEASSAAQARHLLAELCGWDLDDLTALSDLLGLPPADYGDERALTRLVAALSIARRTGVPAASLAAWATTPPDPEQVTEIVTAAKARFDDDTWAQAAKPVNDTLRDRRRERLVAYLLPMLGKRNADELFAHFLIDVEMTSAMTTSRIKQAISTVQVFIQRCLLNIEPAVSPAAIDAEQLEWRSNYRIWEANRKVFLFPENWIYPSLRDNKTPLFTELEQQLLSDELTADNVEQHYRGYLDGLLEISRLDILAICPQHESGASLLHVFARTFTEPYAYFHRTLKADNTWTAWQQIPIDITDTTLIPVIWNRQLRLCWPIVTETREEARIRIAWTVYQHGRWARRQVSADDAALAVGKGEDRQLSWDTAVSAGDLLIDCYRYRGIQSEFTLGPDLMTPGYKTSLEYQSIGTFRFHGCGGSVSSRNHHYQSHSWTDGDFVFIETPSGLNLRTLGNHAGSGGRSIDIFATFPNGVPNTANPPRSVSPNITTTHPWAPSLFAPGETFMYSDAEHTYLVHSRWTSTLIGAVLNPDSVPLVADYLIARQSRNLLAQETRSLTNSPLRLPDTTPERVAHPIQISPGTGGIYLSDVNDKIGRLLPHTYEGNVALSFTIHYHPHICAFYAALNSEGLPGLMTLRVQNARDADPGVDKDTTFAKAYKPTPRVGRPYPHESVDFSAEGAYSDYNWELFFHAPLLIALALSNDQKFDEAERWFRYIFDPTSTSTDPIPARYWNVKPFHDSPPATRLADMLAALDYRGTDPKQLADKTAVQAQLHAMAADPFNPHHIARLRPVAYQKTVVMQYIEHTLARGDHHFRRNEIDLAVLHYLRASALLGRRPEPVPQQPTPAKTYRELIDGGELNDFSNILVVLENAFPFTIDGTVSQGPGAVAPLGTTLYFCIPPNTKLLGYWDAVADRLFKIRHGLDIDGIARHIPLFEPPIDPGLLVKARAAGLDLDSVLNNLGAPTSPDRFAVLLERAKRLCQELQTLGATLLSALEKKDAEALAVMRSTHEIALLDLTKRVKDQQIAEARLQREALDEAHATTIRRRDFYSTALQTALIDGEKDQLRNLDSADRRQKSAAGIEKEAQTANAFPNLSAGGGTTGTSWSSSYGGSQIAAIFSARSRNHEYLSSSYNYKANRAAIVAGHTRRADEWQRELDIAHYEGAQIVKQQAALDIQIAMAEHEAANHQTQADQARDELDFLRTKYTAEKLYTWMIDQISTVYFQTYRLTYDLAKQCERAHQVDLGTADSNFIQFGYWDSLRHGLLAGDRLQLALAQLEDAYHRRNRRELEITKSISLQSLDPVAMMTLKATGTCEFTLPEQLFDADYPGHYMRRIKTVSLTIPCIVGPHTSVNATLRLLKSKTRINPSAAGDYRERDNDARFTYHYGAVDAIATSHGQHDNGMFELNFRDDRYLPFEGAGAVSTWRLEMYKYSNAFDFDTITKPMLNISYTARDAGAPLHEAARKDSIDTKQAGRRQLFSVRQEFPDEWHRFIRPEPTADRHRMTLSLHAERFPFQLRRRKLEITGVQVFLELAEGTTYPGNGQPLTLSVTPPADPTPLQAVLTRVPATQIDLPLATLDLSAQNRTFGDWTIEALETHVAKLATPLQTGTTTHRRLNRETIRDMLIILEYTA